MDGEPWFPAKDVCDVLGLTNARQAVQKNCQPEDVQTVFRSKVSTGDVSFPARGMNCVSEAGLYELVFASRRPEARAFRRWVAATVLPAISKDGMYVRGEESVETEEDVMALSLRAMEGLQKKLNPDTGHGLVAGAETLPMT